MQRHITDHPHSHQDSIRLKAFLDVERSQKTHRVYETLHRQAQESGNAMTREFLRIERGITA